MSEEEMERRLRIVAKQQLEEFKILRKVLDDEQLYDFLHKKKEYLNSERYRQKRIDIYWQV